MPSVTTNEGRRRPATSRPFKIPTAIPITGPIMKHSTQVKFGCFAHISATTQAVKPTVDEIERSIWRIITIGAIPIARSATTEVEVKRSLVPSPVKNLGLIKPVPPTAKIKIIAKLPSRLEGFNLRRKSILSTLLSGSSGSNNLFLSCLFS